MASILPIFWHVSFFFLSPNDLMLWLRQQTNPSAEYSSLHFISSIPRIRNNVKYRDKPNHTTFPHYCSTAYRDHDVTCLQKEKNFVRLFRFLLTEITDCRKDRKLTVSVSSWWFAGCACSGHQSHNFYSKVHDGLLMVRCTAIRAWSAAHFLFVDEKQYTVH